MQSGKGQMKLPENFTFTQQNLQDFVDCRFRFYLKYIKQLDWPAVESEPLVLQEFRMELGRQFHLLVERYLSGIDVPTLTASIVSPELLAWWEAFMGLELDLNSAIKSAEKTLSMPFKGYRLLAKYDLLLETETGRIIIYDWKTSPRRPSPQVLQSRLQSRVYPFVLHHSRANQPVGEIEMSYWFPADPQRPFQFEYSEKQFAWDEEYLSALIEEILTLSEKEALKTDDDKRCLYCRYRSLCDRGITAGELEPDNEQDFTDDDFNIDFEES